MASELQNIKPGRVSELINSTFKFLDEENGDSRIRNSTVANGNSKPRRVVANGNCSFSEQNGALPADSASPDICRFPRNFVDTGKNCNLSNGRFTQGNITSPLHSWKNSSQDVASTKTSSISKITVDNNVVTVSLGSENSGSGHDSTEGRITSSHDTRQVCDKKEVDHEDIINRKTESCAGTGEKEASICQSVQTISNDSRKCTCKNNSVDLKQAGGRFNVVQDSCIVHGHSVNNGSDQALQNSAGSSTQTHSGTIDNTVPAGNSSCRSETPSPSHGGVVMRSTSRRRRRTSQGSTLSDREGDGECHSPGSPLQRLKQTGTPAGSGDSDSQQGSEEDEDDDDDAGIYDESYRRSTWMYLGDDNELKLTAVDIDIDGPPDDDQRVSYSSLNSQESSPCGYMSQDSSRYGDMSQEGGTLADSSRESGNFDCSTASSNSVSDLEASRSFGSMSECDPVHNGEREHDEEDNLLDRTDDSIGYVDDVFHKPPPPPQYHHKRSESISTTVSEIEFRKHYQARTRRTVQRKSSTHTYQRMSERIYDQERIIMVEKPDHDQEFGFHIKGSAPVVITTVEPGSPGARAGLKAGDVLLSINDVVVVDVTHDEVVKLLGADGNKVKLEVAKDRVIVDAPLCSGYLVKQGGSGILKNWRRRWFTLKPDHCLYYYKDPSDKDPLGAIHLTNYTITKAPEINRKYTFKASKFGQRTYYFQADSEAEMNKWANAMGASAQSGNKTDTWLDISSHNVGLPALSIKKPDCHGHLTKLGTRRKYWKRRYCVLKDACLYYYLDVTSSTAQGVAHLHGYEVEESIPYSKKFGFTLAPPEPKMRTFYFYADNETDRKRWIIALRKSIGRWVKAEDM